MTAPTPPATRPPTEPVVEPVVEPEPRVAALVRRYIELAPAADSAAYFALFADDAVVEDEGREWRGLDAIRGWRGQVPRVSYAVASLEATGSGALARVEIADDFPGSPVTLGFAFEVTPAGRIGRLAIRP